MQESYQGCTKKGIMDAPPEDTPAQFQRSDGATSRQQEWAPRPIACHVIFRWEISPPRMLSWQKLESERLASVR